MMGGRLEKIYCDKNVIKIIKTGIIIVTDRIIVKATTL